MLLISCISILQPAHSLDPLFNNPINISNNLGDSGEPRVSVVGDQIVNIAWFDDNYGNYDIFFARSTDDGASFEPIENLSNNSGSSTQVRLGSSGNNTYIAWQDDISGNNDISFRSSVDGGDNFSESINISNNSGDSRFPKVASIENQVYVVWHDNSTGNFETYYTKSNDGGNTFTNPTILTHSTGRASFPDIALSNSSLNIVWGDNSLENYDIFLMHSTYGGTTFEDPINLSNNLGSSAEPRISTSGNNTYVVWYDDTLGNFDVFFTRSTDGGASFEPPINLSDNAGESSFPKITSTGNNVSIVWQDNTLGNSDVFLTRSIDYGANFSEPLRITNNYGTSEFPFITADLKDLYIVWEDDTSGNNEIMFEKILKGDLPKPEFLWNKFPHLPT